jgi:hypothetical protein
MEARSSAARHVASSWDHSSSTCRTGAAATDRERVKEASASEQQASPQVEDIIAVQHTGPTPRQNHSTAVRVVLGFFGARAGGLPWGGAERDGCSSISVARDAEPNLTVVARTERFESEARVADTDTLVRSAHIAALDADRRVGDRIPSALRGQGAGGFSSGRKHDGVALLLNAKVSFSSLLGALS